VELIFEILAQIVWWLIEIFAELLISLLGETLADLFDYKVADRRAQRLSARGGQDQPVDAAPSFGKTCGKAVIYTFLGAAFGFFSTLVFPHSFIHSPLLQWAGILVIPVVSAWAMVKLGDWRHSRGKVASGMDQFMFAYCFALSMAVIRHAYIS
jgi:hypothetical protein